MAHDGIDLSQLDGFTDRLIQSSREAAKLQKKFLREQGTKLVRKTKAKARVEVQKTAVKRKEYTREAGKYHKGLKRGKVYFKDGGQQIRVYTGDPIGHLIEKGWTPKLRNGSKGEKQPGKEIVETAAAEFEEQFNAACEDAIEEMIRAI